MVRDDGAGHQAAEQAIHELQELGMVRLEDRWITFTEQGEIMLDQIIAGMREAAARGR